MKKNRAWRALVGLGITGLLFLPSAWARPETGEAGAATLTVRTGTLEECCAISEAQYQPLKLAQEEIDVAHSKAAEAARELWPNLAAKAEKTNGAAVVDLGTPGFREESYGLQLTYTLFQGGRLWAAYRQADAHLRIAQMKYEKTRQEMIHLITEAYWNLIRTLANKADYEEAYKDADRYFRMAEHLHQAGTLMTKLLLATASQKNQAAYQIQNATAEVEKFLWKWTEALGLEQPPQILPQAEIRFDPLEINLPECLKIAEEQSPEIHIQTLLLEASEYERRTKTGSDWPKLELNGFYGRSGGAYNSEDLVLSEDYNVGVKLTQPFTWNSLALSGFQQKTSPKLGQSSRTESQTASATLSFLDGYKNASEKQEAALHWHQAEYNLDKSHRTVADEVREAYYNYRKALAQVRNAQLDLDLADREWAIQKINLRDDKASMPEVAEARNKLAGARVTLREAQVFYLISLSALNKAVGVVDKFQVKIKDESPPRHEDVQKEIKR